MTLSSGAHRLFALLELLAFDGSPPPVPYEDRGDGQYDACSCPASDGRDGNVAAGPAARGVGSSGGARGREEGGCNYGLRHGLDIGGGGGGGRRAVGRGGGGGHGEGVWCAGAAGV